MPSITLYNGDCLEVMKELPDKSVDLIICDLPYGCLSAPRATVGAGWRKVKEMGGVPELIREKQETCAWDIKINLEAFWIQVKRIRKSDNTPTIHFCSTRFGNDLINSNSEEFRYDLVWNKTNAVGFLSANKKPMASHEMIYVFSKKSPFYTRINIKGDFAAGGGGTSSAKFLPIAGMPNLSTTIAGERCPVSVITVANKKRKDGHPTEKSPDLYKFLIERYCVKGGTVLDPTFGSGNSVFTAADLGCNAIGIEKDETFFKKAEERLNKF